MMIYDALSDIQHRMRAPKDKKNEFGGYNYRSAESILAAFKALGIEDAAVTCSDGVQEVAGQIFITATARLVIGGESVEVQGHAMHPLQKKGMDASQITGSASSYARKYALCGLFAIEDESQDPDARDNRGEHGQTPPPVITVSPEQFIKLRDACEEAGVDPAKVCAINGAPSLEQFPASDFDGAMRKLNATIKAKAQTGDEIPYEGPTQ